ncbi:radical SAM protein [Desulfogranum marinum]|uniref:radical SAM protein n=1 Tax=Desulfogranum marinum TaxID=453220 RepID=UPI0029C96198|nr:radical SAM protein [Desulfogranum marinum]
MKYTPPVYRPPFEANSLLLQVTAGCSHNKCAFCSMYNNVPFQVEQLEQIEKDLVEARRLYPSVKRVFLVSGDPFVLKVNQLIRIAEKVNHHLPEVETIAMYASIANITSKNNEELKALRSLKINDLNIGLESGLPSVVKNLNKGFTIQQAKVQCKRLATAGFDFSLNIIIGAAGNTMWEENALASAKIINEIQPHLIFVAALHLEEDCELATRLQQGSFIENTLRENIEEEILLLQNLELDRTRFFAVHPSNAIPVDGYLPEEKGKLLEILKNGRDSIEAEWLNTRNTSLVTGGEGAILLNPKR